MRYKKLILLGALGVAGFIPAFAQLPEIGTAESPKWYYIQVLGTDERAGLVFTLEDGGKVKGRAMSTSTDLDEVSKQLWRFEQDGSGRYTIVNKSSGGELALTYDEGEESSIAVAVAESDMTFAFNALGDYYQIKSDKIPEGGAAGEYWLHQGNSGYSFSVITVGTSWNTAKNSKFHFVAFVDPSIQFSDGETETWYNLTNCSASFEKWSVKEDKSEEADAKLVLEQSQGNDASAQWKAIKANVGEGVHFVNRATGNSLATESAVFGAFNLLQPTSELSVGNGWTPVYLGNLQYAFKATDVDGVMRYLGATASTATNSDEVDPEKLAGSVYSWKLQKVDETVTGIARIEGEGEGFRVEGRRVVADKGVDISVFTTAGVAVQADRQLEPGVYVVTAKGKSSKVLIP